MKISQRSFWCPNLCHMAPSGLKGLRNIGREQREMRFHLISKHESKRYSNQLIDYQVLLTSSLKSLKSKKAKGKEKLFIFKLGLDKYKLQQSDKFFYQKSLINRKWQVYLRLTNNTDCNILTPGKSKWHFLSLAANHCRMGTCHHKAFEFDTELLSRH